jgi:hypothetical protein
MTSATCYNVALMPTDDESVNEAVFAARSSGRSIVAIAAEFERSEVEVRLIIASMVQRTYDSAKMREDIAYENARLLALSLKYYALAMADDHQAAVIYTKVSERRMTMLGGNAPAQYSVHLSNAAAPEHEDSTSYYERMIEELKRDHQLVEPGEEGEPGKPN